MEEFYPLVVPMGLASVLVCLLICITKIVIVRMAIKGVPSTRRAEVLRAASCMFRKERRSKLEQHPRDGPPDDTG
jgi:hypothetical protein